MERLNAKFISCYMLACVVLAVCMGQARAATRTWNAATTGAWDIAANWFESGAPTDGDDVYITNPGACAILAGSSSNLNSITISKTLVFTNWNTALIAANVTILDGGAVTVANAFSNSPAMSNRVWIVCTNLTVETNGVINVDGKGYAGGRPGCGPGSGASALSGAGYGGRGGMWSSFGAPYGSTNAPLAPGSGGGGNSAAGGAGGGAVRIEAAGGVTIDGVITANGAAGDFGGGSGGGIYITCGGVFSGGTSGVIRANGAGNNVGGGGGRIAIDCANIDRANVKVRFSAAAGTSLSTSAGPAAGMGTLYLVNTNLISETLELFDKVRVYIPGFTVWNVPDLVLSNRVVALGALEGGALNLSVTNDLMIVGGGGLSLGGVAISNGLSEVITGPASNPAVTVGGNLVVNGGSALTLGINGSGSKVVLNVGTNVALNGGRLAVGGLAQALQGELTVGHDLTLTNGGALVVYGGMTNAVATNYGALVTVPGALTIGSGCWVYPYSHPTNGGSTLFRVGTLAIAANGGFNADGKGYHGNKGAPYPPGYTPYYPGNGPGGGGFLGGGGYGGKGGYDNGGNPCGSTNAPIAPGSAGGGNDAGTPLGGAGGGLVYIESSGDVTVHGIITANGTNSALNGGAGGGIFIACAGGFSGDTGSVLRANGGNAASWGAGGGGRISVAIGLAPDALDQLITGQVVPGLYAFPKYNAFLGAISVTNGVSGNPARNGQPGTWVFLTTNQYRLTIKGQPVTYGSPTPDGYGTRIDLPLNTPIANSVASPTNQVGGLRRACSGWTLTDETDVSISNIPSIQAEFALFTNLVLTWNWTNEYQLTVSAGSTNGSVNSNAVNGWYTNAITVAGLTAIASDGYVFSQWTGDVPSGSETNNPLTVTMDQARTITANFYSEAGETKIWNGLGVWESATNWTPSGMPNLYDHVIIASGSIVLGNSRQVRSLIVSNGATLVFTNWATSLAAEDVTIGSGGAVTVANAFSNSPAMSNRVWIVCTNLTVETNGVINVDGKGYAGGRPGCGPGSGASALSGAGYGGRGGMWSSFGAFYGSTNAPLAPGSGGGGNSAAGGAGGGAVRIEAAGGVTIDGVITANGAAGDFGGGSGGGIYITCGGVFSGGTSGVIRANGADNNVGGGGGRIAIDCANVDRANVKVRFSAAAGLSLSASAGPAAGMGTLYLVNTNLISETLELFDKVRVYIPGFTGWNVPDLVLSNRVVALGALEGGALNLSVANDLTIVGGGGLSLGGVAISNGLSDVITGPASNPAVTVGGNLVVSGGSALTLGISGQGSTLALTVKTNVLMDAGTLVVGGMPQISCGTLSIGNTLELTNGGAMRIYGGVTNSAATNYGTLVTVTGAVSIGAASWIHPYSQPTNGGSVLFRFGSLVISSNGGFNADAKGYNGNKGAPYPPGYSPYYPGNGPGGGGYLAGGGYGGKGGYGNGVQGGSPYGTTNAPVDPGSAAGGNDGGSPLGGAGGGLVRIESAGDVTMNGVITANGTNTGISAGSGGGIFIICSGLFEGGSNALLQANGGNSVSWGGGGGGRIAVWYEAPAARILGIMDGSNMRHVVITNTHPRFFGMLSVTNGRGSTNLPPNGAEPGTIIFLTVTRPGSVLCIK